MVTTRSSQPLAAEQPETPKQMKWLSDESIRVNDALERLGKLADITFPLRSELESPAKRNRSPTHEIKKLFTDLFYTNRSVLIEQVHTFLGWLPMWSHQYDEKLEYLHGILSNAHKANFASIRSSSRANRYSSGKHALSPPHSPTMFVKHISSGQTEVIDEIQLPSAARIASNTTSNNTSFANTSVWSERQKSSQDPPSPATTMNDSFHSTQDYGSSWNESAVTKFPARMAAAGFSVGEAMQLDGTNDNMSSQLYGPSFGSSQIRHLDRTEAQSGKSSVDPSVEPPEAAKKTPSESVMKQSTEAKRDRSSEAKAGIVSPDAVDQQSRLPSELLHSSEATNIAGNAAFQSSETAMGKSSATTTDGHGSTAHRPSDASPDESPKDKGENVRVRNLVHDGLTDLHLPPSVLKMDLEYRSAFYLVMQGCKIDPEDLERAWTEPRTLSSLHEIARTSLSTFRRFGSFSYAECSLRAKLGFSDALEGRLMVMKHVRPQKQLPNLLEMEFGFDRFLTVDVEPLKPPERLGLASQSARIQNRLQEMLKGSQEFLGYTWQQFYAQERKRRKIGEDPAEHGAMQYVFFATKGVDLRPMCLSAVLDRVLQFQMNKGMALCKLYARLDLAMSRTDFIPMHPSEIEYVDDTYATEDREDSQFNDPEFDFGYKFDKSTVMNDGCCEADERLFERIRDARSDEVVATGAQIRGAGGKGMIVQKSPSESDQSSAALDYTRRATYPQTPDPLIRLTASMRKVMMPDKVMKNESLENHLIALRVVQIVHPLKTSFLYTDLMTILVDRHVPKAAIEELVGSQAKQDVQDFNEALSSGEGTRAWLHNQHASREDQKRDGDGGIETLANFPVAPAEKMIQMLDAGFEPTKSRPLAELTRTVAKAFFDQQQRAYKVPLGKSTMALAVADSGRYLKPDEIQLNLSSGIKDTRTGKCTYRLKGPVLIARLPASRPSDIQKVTAVYKPELSHIVDQVIFPTTGPRPLAGKCSGGDYDGDKFWICWEPSLVGPFLNAPAPWFLPDPASLGIKVDTVRTRDILSDTPTEEQIIEFVRRGTVHRMRGTMLGIIQKTMEKIGYVNNKISSPAYTAHADLKDRVIDSDKNGYIFEGPEFAQFKKNHGVSILPQPAYTEITDSDNDLSREYAPVNPDHILDRVHCIILPRILKKALECIENKLADAVGYDYSLSKDYEMRLADANGDPVLYTELSRLETELAVVRAEWGKQMRIWGPAKPSRKAALWETAVVSCRDLFDAIQPLNPKHPAVKEWLRPRDNAPTIWDLIKASAIAKFHCHGKMWFNVVGDELCAIKAPAMGRIRTVLVDKYVCYRPRKRRKVAEENGDDGPAEPREGDADMAE